jgi:hypothetical protein
MDTVCDSCYDFFMKFKPVMMFYSSWICLHYFSAHLYTYFCTPANWYGIFASPFLSTAPHCNALRWTISESGDTFKSMWIAAGSWFVSSFFTYDKITRTTRSKS